MTSTTDIDTLAAALISLARSNIPPDVQELLLHGNPDRGIQPGALKRLIEQVTGDLRSTAFHVISDIRKASGLGARPMLSELAAEIGKLRARAEAAEAALCASDHGKSAAAVASGILIKLGIAQAPTFDPGADPRRDWMASMIQGALDLELHSARAETQTARELAATWAVKAKVPVIVTDEMVDRVFVLACCARPVGASDGCGTVEIRMPTRSSLRAALEAVFAPREE